MPRIALIAVTLLFAGCAAGRPPALAEGARLEAVGRIGQASPGWTARLNDRFPPGTPVAAVEAALRGEGFVVDGEAGRARYRWTRYPCANTLDVRWRADAEGRLSAIEGGYSNACT